MSKRSIRLVAGIAGAAMALGTMAPAMADRLGGDDTSNGGGNHRPPVDVRCLSELPDLFPVNVNVNPEHPFQTYSNSGLLGGLLDIGLNDTDNVDTLSDGPHAGVFGSGPLGIYGLDPTLRHVLMGAIDAGLCITTPVISCVEDAVDALTPINVNVDPSKLGHNFPGGVDLGLDATSNNPGDGVHMGALGTPFYGVGETLRYAGDVVLGLADCLHLNLTGPGGVSSCLEGLNVFPLNANVNPGHPVQVNGQGGLADLGLGATSSQVGEDQTHIGVFGSRFPIYVDDDSNLGQMLFCLTHGGGDDELLSAVTGMTGGSSLAPMSLVSPVSSVFGLSSGISGTLTGSLTGSLTSVLSPGSAGISASLLASVVAVL